MYSDYFRPRQRRITAACICLLLFNQDSVCLKSAPVGDTPSTPRKGSNGLSSPAKSVERCQSTEEQKTTKIKPPALNNITSEATSTMSPPPAKKLALSAKKVIFICIRCSSSSCQSESSWFLVFLLPLSTLLSQIWLLISISNLLRQVESPFLAYFLLYVMCYPPVCLSNQPHVGTC